MWRSRPRYLDKIWFSLKEKIGATEFLGYEHDKSEGIVLSLIKKGKEVQEINDGNINYAFVVTNKLDSKQSVFVKQAPPYIKVLGEGWPLTRQRMTAEINALNYQSSVCPEMVPEVYYQSEVLSLLIMQNLSKHIILRAELVQGRYLPRLAEDLSTFLAETLFHSSDFALSSLDKKAMVSKSSNQDMCKITEDFVFTYPFEHHEMNDYNPALSQFVIDSIQKNPT